MNTCSTEVQAATESEANLWIASKEYLQGDINVHQLEDIELPHASNFKAATLALARSQLRIFIILFLAFGFLISTVVGILISLISKNWFPLILCAIPLIFFCVIGEYILPLDKRRFNIQAEKIRLREQKYSKIREIG